ncbi:hypothetical protein AHiyo8_43040 [Arthrobacter sp. Hiyo8]|nr:hypothetical protein AHiyo8_43040 [Arthrobacter sp. Hiyo8]
MTSSRFENSFFWCSGSPLMNASSARWYFSTIRSRSDSGIASSSHALALARRQGPYSAMVAPLTGDVHTTNIPQQDRSGMEKRRSRAAPRMAVMDNTVQASFVP